MTREEQIAVKLHGYSLDIELQSAFYDGATWADSNRWVKVEDDKPLTDNVIVACKHGVMECKFVDGCFVIYPYSDGVAYPTFIPDVTHWMPLPSPPKAEQ